jgi:hypothetical protein
MYSNQEISLCSYIVIRQQLLQDRFQWRRASELVDVSQHTYMKSNASIGIGNALILATEITMNM